MVFQEIHTHTHTHTHTRVHTSYLDGDGRLPLPVPRPVIGAEDVQADAPTGPYVHVPEDRLEADDGRLGGVVLAETDLEAILAARPDTVRVRVCVRVWICVCTGVCVCVYVCVCVCTCVCVCV